jgi:hypothetical protein
MKTPTNRHLQRIAQSMMTGGNKRSLQMEAANRFDMEFMLVGDEGKSSAISFVNTVLSSTSLAAVAVSLLLLF